MMNEIGDPNPVKAVAKRVLFMVRRRKRLLIVLPYWIFINLSSLLLYIAAILYIVNKTKRKRKVATATSQ